jgi:hypothetical protein
MIKFGSIEYFRLLDFRDRLRNRGYDKLDLFNLDKLRNEIDIKIMRIELTAKEHEESKREDKD